MIPPHDTEGKQISESVAIKQGIAALLTTSAEAEQKWYDAYLAEKQRADNFEKKYNEKCSEVEQLKAIIAAMQVAKPTMHYHIAHDYVANQYVENNERSDE